ncbi:MAG: hypothetical protein ICV75_03815 [Nitrospiraceae bacterium]|nr:hypothetical protein [Nitrospiraceae bacterium]
MLAACRTTLQELSNADVLLHIVDASAPNIDVHITAVVDTLEELGVSHHSRLLELNKCDRLPAHYIAPLCRRCDTIGISALQPEQRLPRY